MGQLSALRNSARMWHCFRKIQIYFRKCFAKKSFGGVKHLTIPMRRRVHINRTFKDRLFREIFSRDKQALLQLYNALNGTDYQDADVLEVITIEDVLYIGMRNDLTYLLVGTINLYEHQSTYNGNMPLRFLVYICQEYLRYVDSTEQDVYGEKTIMLPTPHFVVFYNGEKEMPDERIVHLSDAYMSKVEEKSLEVTVRMINVNYGRSSELMRKCSRLEEYAIFVHQIRKNLKKGMKLKRAVDGAIHYCIDNGVLVDYLKKYRFRARAFEFVEYGSKRHLYMVRRDAKEEGREEGSLQTLCSLVRQGIITEEEAATELNLSVEEFAVKRKGVES